MTAKVFIDGAAGTTGLEIRERLSGRRELDLVALPDDRRKDAAARREALNAADVVILCLPDDAAREAVALIDNPAVKVIDASTAHRTAEGWTYGFPELAPGQRQALRAATRVTNPGCYPTGFLALAAPLVRADVIPPVWPVTVNAMSGYSGGGKSMIAEFEDRSSPTFTEAVVRTYGLGLNHKHVEEMRVHAGLDYAPLFAPTVGRFYRGMLVEIPLQLWSLPTQPDLEDIHEILAQTYADEPLVEVVPLEQSLAMKGLDAEVMAGANALRLFVFGSPGGEQARLVAALDNLGKGAAGAAVQNLNIMMGWPETEGLV